MGACWHIRHYNTMASGELSNPPSIIIENSYFIIETKKNTTDKKWFAQKVEYNSDDFLFFFIRELGKDFHIAIYVLYFSQVFLCVILGGDSFMHFTMKLPYLKN